jgi:hypothetical protein
MGTIKSQPVYAPLAPVEQATRHVLVSAGAGALAVERVLHALSATAAVRVLHWETGETAYSAPLLTGPFAAQVAVYREEKALIEVMGSLFSTSPVGARLYVAGPELFIWKVALGARSAGWSRTQMQTELCGSKARRVYCVHCKALNEGVTSTICVCTGCGLPLFVRDHFSRLLQAYAGVRADAEEPGNVPAPEPLYQ